MTATGETAPVLCEVRDTGVAVLTLNRPERMNGWGASLDLLLSGRVFYADEAAELGLVKEVVAPEELLPRAIGYAEDIAANCAPSFLAVIKQQVYADTIRDVFEVSDAAEKLMHESMGRPDFIEGFQPDTIYPVVAITKELSMRFVFAYRPDEFARALRWIVDGTVDVGPLITGIRGLDDAADAFAQLRQPEQHCKILLTPGDVG